MPNGSRFRPLPVFLPLVSTLAVPAAAQEARIENTAMLHYRAPDGTNASVQSNTAVFEVARRGPTRISFYRPPTDFDFDSFGCASNPMRVVPASVDAAALAASKPVMAFDAMAPFVVAISDPYGNKDATKREVETLTLRGADRTATVDLLETAPNSGVFAGGFDFNDPDTLQHDCRSLLTRGQRLMFRFPGDDDSDGSDNSLLVDPAGYVFDSSTGAIIDGATVTLVDADGAPAKVKGEDGVSDYPSTMVTGTSVTDASGRVYPAMKGRYRFPLIAPGSYRLRVDPPALYRAPSTKEPAALSGLRTPREQPFVINAEASYANLFVQGSSDLVVDIPVDPGNRLQEVTGSDNGLLLTKAASVRQAAPGDLVEYRLELRGPDTATRAGLHLIDKLPAGLRYRRGSTRGAVEPVIAADGRQLDFTLPAVGAAGVLTIRYAVSIAPGAPAGEALNRARVVNGSADASNEAVAAVRLQPLPFTDALTLIGRVTQGDCGAPASGRQGVANVRVLLEDGSTVVTDSDGLYHVEGLTPGRHVVQLDSAGLPASLEPVACDRDTRQAGSAISRFVEGVGGTVKRVDFQLRATGRRATVVAKLPAVADDANAAGNRDWLAGQSPGIAWLFPEADHNPRVPTIRVAIKHKPGQHVALMLAGKLVDPLAFDTIDEAGEIAVSRWSGIALQAGDNRLSARVLDENGAIVTTLERVVHVSGAPARAEVDLSASHLIADGLTQPILAVRLTDRAGRPVRANTMVPFAVDAPYRAAQLDGDEGARALAARDRIAATARVMGDNGLALMALQPTTQAGALRVRVTLAEENTTRDIRLAAALAPGARGWTVVGFGAGSLGYDTLSRHARPLVGREHGLPVDGQLALYAKGRIKGSWLLTLAYDSARAYDPDRGLLGVINPDRYYTVYGDGAQQVQDAPTRRKLYLRLESRTAYALFGDFETGLTDTVLTRFSRTLNGAKAGYEGKRLRGVAFAAQTDARHVRDEIRGNGLTGPYRLSARGIVPNSDQLVIEVRDRFRPERIVSRTTMARHLDYDIDPTLGTVRFRAPVLGRDSSLNPIVVVIDYEVEQGRSNKTVAGGRIDTRLGGGAVEMGASLISDATFGSATVAGADLKAHLGPATELRAEIATGGQGGLRTGQAFIAEAEHHRGGVDVLAYARQQDIGFGVGQQNAVEAGTRKLGIDGRVQLTEQLSLAGTAWHQATLDTPATRIAADLRLEYRRAAGTIFAGVQIASDRGLDGADRNSRLLTVGGSQSLFDNKLVISGQTQWAPGGDKSSADFPVRHQVTASYRLLSGVRLVGGYEIADCDKADTRTARVGVELAPWRGAALTGTVNQQGARENGARTYAQYGLAQSIPLGAHWTIDGTFDASTTVRGAIDPGALVNALQPPSSGGLAGEDYVAATLGAGFRADRWSWNGRLEHRRADTGTRWGLTTNVLRTLGEGRTVAASVKLYSNRDRAGATVSSAASDVALALRPLDSRWSVLERLSFRQEQADAAFDDSNVLGVSLLGGIAQSTSRVVNNLAVNYRTGVEGQGHGLEATVYHGAKYVRGRYADEEHDGFIDVVGFDVRRDAGTRFDIGVQGSVQHAWNGEAWAWSGGPSVGVSPAGNWWLTAGYNASGYRDHDFSQDRYTRAGPYLTFRLKVDQTGIAEAVRSLFGGAFS